MKPKVHWIEENKKLRQKNAYFTKEIPKLKGKLDRLTVLLEEQKKKHIKEMRESNHELLKATAMLDSLQANFNIMAAIKMGELFSGAEAEILNVDNLENKQ